MKTYPKINLERPDEVKLMLHYVNKERVNDVSDWDNLINRFISGRKVAKVPTGAADVADTDRIGDINWDYASGYLYLLVDNAGTAVWSRIALDTSW